MRHLRKNELLWCIIMTVVVLGFVISKTALDVNEAANRFCTSKGYSDYRFVHYERKKSTIKIVCKK